MTIKMTDEVKEYLEKKHKHTVEVYAHRLFSGYDGPISHVEVTMNVPASINLDNFQEFLVDDFKVYVEKPLVDEHEIMIKLDHLLGMKHLEVKID